MRCPSPLQPQLLYSSIRKKKHILYTHPMCVVFVSNLLSVLRSVLLYHSQKAQTEDLTQKQYTFGECILYDSYGACFEVNHQMLLESSPQELGMLKRERSERLTS